MDIDEDWCPTPINTLDSFFRYGIEAYKGVQFVYAYRKNLSYNFQYLEYLNHCVENSWMQEVIKKMTYKSFIITGIGMMEAIIYYKIRENGLNKDIYLMKKEDVGSNVFKMEGKEYKTFMTIYEKVDYPVEIEMTFNAMLSKVEDKKLMGEDQKIYKKLNYLRKLRNKVHLHQPQDKTDTDYNAFGLKEFSMMKEILYMVFTSSWFSSSEEELKFLDFLK